MNAPEEKEIADQGEDPEALLEESAEDAELAIAGPEPGEGERMLHAAFSSINVNELSADELDNFIQQLSDLRKPGLIIDGQHRVRGTYKDNILFNVTALPDAAWPELAFQFIVLNLAAKKVEESLLINIVGNSMSPGELEKIDTRLNDSGIDVPLYQGVMRIHEDLESPFYEKLKFGLGKETGIIEAASAKTKIVNFWFSGKLLYPLVSHLLPGRTKQDKLQHWQSSSMWYEFLKAFWGSARDFFSKNSSVWSNELEADKKTPASRLMRVTVTNLTQIAIVQSMTKALTSEIENDVEQKKTMKTLLPNVERFQQHSKTYFERLTPDFFTDWGPSAKGLDGSVAIKEAYIDAVKDVISKKATPQKLKTDQINLIFKK